MFSPERRLWLAYRDYTYGWEADAYREIGKLCRKIIKESIDGTQEVPESPDTADASVPEGEESGRKNLFGFTPWR